MGDERLPSSNYSSDSEATRVAKSDSSDKKRKDQVEPKSDDNGKGRWGEQYEGEGVNVGQALEEYRQLSRRISRTTKRDEEEAAGDSEDERFDLAAHVRRRKAAYADQGLHWEKQLGVIFKDLTVQGVSSDAAFNKDTGRAVIGSFGPDLFNFLAKRFPRAARKVPGYHVPIRPLIQGFTGSLKDEMLLVLGRPGSGCSTFLRAISNETGGFVDVTGNVSYGGISAADMKRKFRGETIYNGEDDLHYPTLTVEQTLRFALTNKVPGQRPEGESRSSFIKSTTDVLLRMFGISHTAKTMVGDAMVRGISGGERKRVSIAESLATGGALTSWDNASRGLDSSTALDYVRSLRILTDVAGRTNIVSLYQASESIFNLFDKVMLIDEGRMVFLGPIADARPYFEDLGYASPDRQTTPDFLTALTDPTQRLVREGYESKAPRTSEEREATFRRSSLYQNILGDIDDFEKELSQDDARAKQLKTTVRSGKSHMLPKASPYTVSLPRSLWALVQRQFLLKWGDRSGFYTKTFTNVAIAFLVGSMFWNTTPTSSGAFSYGGALFFSLLLLGWLNLSEIYEAVQGRAISARHTSFAYYRPSAVALAQVICDLPLNLFQATIWAIIFYFMAQFERSASAFFIYYLFVFISTIALTSFFRAVAALSPNFDSGIRFAVIGLNIAIVFVGYVVPRSDMPSWFKWISYVQPLSFAFEAVMANQFSRISLPCDPMQTVPNIPGADPAFQTCFLQGAEPGSTVVSGSAYIEQSFGYSYANVWRNFGIVIAYTIGYIAAAAIFSEMFSYANTGGASTVFIRTKRAKRTLAANSAGPRDEEEKPTRTADTEKQGSHEDDKVEGLEPSKAIFSWKDVSYSVDTADGERELLHKVSGFVKPGEATALMGASGAGKTTLLNTLSRRMDSTRVSGDILVDGKEPPVSFSRSCGFAEQMDIHDPTQTVREALEFSALLRQSRDIPHDDKIKYVDTIMELLDLEPLQDAIIGTPEAGLTVEQRKRVTIGVELAAKPSILSFFDEPTSGLDSNGAIAIGRFIRRLSRSGQGCLATIHQPSSVLLTTCFDRVLLLSPGGMTSYFGPVSGVTKYFESKGARSCGPDENVAEYALEIVGNGQPWGKTWLESDELKVVNEEIDQITSERKGHEGHYADESEFAASTLTQTRMLSVRICRNFWRDPSYAYGKLATAFLVAIFTGFTFLNLGSTVAQLQQRMFAMFLVLLTLPAIMNASIPRHFILKSYWSSREQYSKTYDWIALLTAILLNEIPYAIITGVLYFIVSYFALGFPLGETAGIVFLNTIMLNLFVPSLTHWLCALAMSPSTVANLLPGMLVTLNIFNGILVPYEMLTPHLRLFVYWANPVVYFLGSVLGAIMHDVPVQCAEAELAVFSPPPGQTCGAYASQAISQMSAQLLNPDATANCQACQYTVGDNYLAGINIQYSERWRDFGIFTAFTISNFALVYLLFYAFQIKGGAMLPAAMIGKLKSKLKRS